MSKQNYLIMENILYHLLFICIVCISAYTYSGILTRAGMIFGKLDAVLEEILPYWLYLPLIGCPKCVAGQIGLWSYYYFTYYIEMDYTWFLHVPTILICIYFTALFTELNNRLLR